MNKYNHNLQSSQKNTSGQRRIRRELEKLNQNKIDSMNEKDNWIDSLFQDKLDDSN